MYSLKAQEIIAHACYTLKDSKKHRSKFKSQAVLIRPKTTISQYPLTSTDPGEREDYDDDYRRATHTTGPTYYSVKNESLGNANQINAHYAEKIRRPKTMSMPMGNHWSTFCFKALTDSNHEAISQYHDRESDELFHRCRSERSNSRDPLNQGKLAAFLKLCSSDPSEGMCRYSNLKGKKTNAHREESTDASNCEFSIQQFELRHCRNQDEKYTRHQKMQREKSESCIRSTAERFGNRQSSAIDKRTSDTVWSVCGDSWDQRGDGVNFVGSSFRHGGQIGPNIKLTMPHSMGIPKYVTTTGHADSNFQDLLAATKLRKQIIRSEADRSFIGVHPQRY